MNNTSESVPRQEARSEVGAPPPFAVSLAKFVMRRFETVPRPPDPQNIGRLNEVFRHEVFTDGSEEVRRDIMLRSSEFFHDEELAYPWDNYFNRDLADLLRGKSVLDLGCFTGGRSVVWCERYELASLVGLDVGEVFVTAARQFAERKKSIATFEVGKGEELQFEDESFDAILSFETFEHVQDVGRTLSQCFRVLRPGGRIFLVFPGYFHPSGHHLGLVTSCPGIQYFFSGRTLVRAYYEILKERGDDACWYDRASPDLEPWERGNTINGMTVGRFRRLIRANPGWRVVYQSRRAVGSVGRSVSRRPVLNKVARLLRPFTCLPVLEEALLHRTVFILEKA